MTSTAKINLWKALVLFAISLTFVLFAKSASAQTTPEDVAQKYGVSFPVDDLDDCNDYDSCRKYCDDPVNLTSCNEYAKKKGFYKDENPAEEKFIKAAKETLGCDSAQSCMKICDDPANHEKCDQFAKKLQLSGGYVHDPGDVKIIEKAKEVLGCDSKGACASFCSQEENRQKCDDFARQSGIRGGEQVRGPGGCTSENTCRSFCLDPVNFNTCSKFTPPDIGKFRGPGGCDSADSCRTYCEQNPVSCRSYAPGSNGRYVPVACPQNQFFGPGGVCTPQEKSQDASNCAQAGKFWNGTSCEDKLPVGIVNVGQTVFTQRPNMGNCSSPGSCYDWCKAHPGQCSGFNPDSPRPNDTFIMPAQTYGSPPPAYQPKADMGNCSSPGSCYDWCKAHPGQCQGFDPNSPRPPDSYNQGSSGAYQPQPNPNMGNCTTASSCYDWCKAHPGQCSGFNPDSPRPSDPVYSNRTSTSGSTQSTTGTSSTTQTNTSQTHPDMGGCTTGASCYDWCKAHPGQCSGFNPDSPRPDDNYQAPTNYSPMPNTQPSSQPAPQPTPSTAPVMGAKTSILDTVVSFFTNLFR